MKTISYVAGLSVIVASLLTAGCSSASESIVTPAMVGHWEGNARIIVSWCHQTNMVVKLDIKPDGTVTGIVGDATLVEGRFLENRGWLGRKLNLATDYIIEGDLSGDIVAAERITRSSVKIPMNLRDGIFVGAVNTSGSGFEGFGGWEARKQGTWLTAGPLKLTRSQ